MRDTTSLGIGREALYSLFSKFAMAAVGFGGTVVFARLLGSEGLGVYQTALAASFVLTQVSGGVGNAIKTRVSEVDVDPGAFLGAGLVIHLAASVVVLVGTLVLLGPASAYFGSAAIALGAVAVVATVGLFNVVNRTYAGIGYPARSTWMDTVRSVLTLGLQLTFLWAGMEVLGLLGGLALGTVAAALLSLVAAGVRPVLPGRETFERVFTFARWSIPNGLLTNLYSSADVMIVTAIVGAGAAGLYAVSLQLTMPAAFLATSIGNALWVKGSGRRSVDEGVVEDLTNSMAYSGLFAVPMVFGALAMPRAIPRTVFGAEFAPAAWAFVGLALFQLGSVYAAQFESVFRGLDRPDVVFRVNVLIAAVHVPLAVALGLVSGLEGVVAATVVAEGIRLATYQYLSHGEFGHVVAPRPIFEQLVSAIAMFGALQIALEWVTIRGWPVLLALVGGGAGLYFGVLFAISPHFRLSLRYALPVQIGPLRTP